MVHTQCSLIEIRELFSCHINLGSKSGTNQIFWHLWVFTDISEQTEPDISFKTNRV